MKKLSIPSAVLLFLSALLPTGGAVLAGPKSSTRDYRPIVAKSVRIELAGAVRSQKGVVGVKGGTGAAREGWVHFDRQEWEMAMDRFLAALESDPGDVSAAEGLAMAVYRSGDRASAAAIADELAFAMPWIRGIVAETVLADVRADLVRGDLVVARTLVEALPHGGGAYDESRLLVEGALAESAAAAGADRSSVASSAQ
jgi:hypothetical protein